MSYPLNSSASVAIIGAGLAGLTCARILSEAGFRVQVFDKGRGVGGRMSVRRVSETPAQAPPFQTSFDHGAQYFTARDPRFQQQVADWVAQGIVAEWAGPFVSLAAGTAEAVSQEEPRYVGVPGMNALARKLAEIQQVTCSCRIVRLTRQENCWKLTALSEATQEHYEIPELYDAVVCTIPAPQAAELLGEQTALDSSDHSIRFLKTLQSQKLGACRCVMLALEEPLDLPWGGAFVQNSLLRWVSRESSKPGRATSPETWVLHATPEWSLQTIEDSPEVVIPQMLEAFAQATGKELPPTRHLSQHLWRHAIPLNPLAEGYLWEEPLQLLVCGDWCQQARVEGSFLSGWKAAERWKEFWLTSMN